MRMWVQNTATNVGGGTDATRRPRELQRVAVCCSVFLMCCSVLQCVVVCGSVLQCFTVCCSVLQCVCSFCSVCFAVVYRRSTERKRVVVCCSVSVLRCVCVHIKLIFAVCVTCHNVPILSKIGSARHVCAACAISAWNWMRVIRAWRMCNISICVYP